jgi:hypothetical protein
MAMAELGRKFGVTSQQTQAAVAALLFALHDHGATNSTRQCGFGSRKKNVALRRVSDMPPSRLRAGDQIFGASRGVLNQLLLRLANRNPVALRCYGRAGMSRLRVKNCRRS